MTRCSVLLVLACAVAAATAEIVSVPGLGEVEGITSTTKWSSRTVYEYRGIPYAQSPEGSRRFRPPVKVDTWPTKLDATQFGQKCPQPEESRLGALRSFMKPDNEAVYQQSRAAALATSIEDCLTLDVYTPTTNGTAKLPVLVYIHGGFFLWGSSASHTPGYLLEHDVILVSIQYRLGPLGFLYMNNENSPGNMGLMDQIMALEWVRDNIAAFGGDPAKVTLGGFSAGAASASLLMLSPLANGLFQRVITQSGSALGYWAIDETVGVDDSKSVAALAGCDQPTEQEIINCLGGKTPEAIIDAYMRFAAEERKNGQIGTGGAMPVIQVAGQNYPEVIVSRPLVTLYKGEYEARPLLAGINKHEGIFALDYVYEEFLVPNDYVDNEDFLKNYFVATLLNAYHVRENSQTFTDAVTRRYFEDEQLGKFDAMMFGLIDLTGAELLKSPWHKQCDLHSMKENDIFMYAWHYYGRHSLMQHTNVSIPIQGGITHGDDTIFLFPSERFPLDDYETKMAKRFVQTYVNFITKGNPTPEDSPVDGVPKWQRFNRTEEHYMNFNDETTLGSYYRSQYTVCADEGIVVRSSAFATFASPLLIVVAALYHLLH